jgi:hypothetical protein
MFWVEIEPERDGPYGSRPTISVFLMWHPEYGGSVCVSAFLRFTSFNVSVYTFELVVSSYNAVLH